MKKTNNNMTNFRNAADAAKARAQVHGELHRPTRGRPKKKVRA